MEDTSPESEGWAPTMEVLETGTSSTKRPFRFEELKKLMNLERMTEPAQEKGLADDLGAKDS